MTPPESSFADLLGGAIAELGIPADAAAIEGMARHFALVVEANRTLNLTAILEPAEAAAKHYGDSLAVVRVLDGLEGGAKRAVDIGSGAGFPGIPLAILRPDWRWTLVEAKRKKADFLTHAVRTLALENVEVVCGRSEELAREAPWRDGFDLAVGRAVAALGAVAEILLPLVRPGGVAAAMKGPSEQTGAQSASDALARLGAEGPDWIEYDLPGGHGRRTLAVFRKVSPTPAGFPRRPGMAEKRPLF